MLSWFEHDFFNNFVALSLLVKFNIKFILWKKQHSNKRCPISIHVISLLGFRTENKRKCLKDNEVHHKLSSYMTAN